MKPVAAALCAAAILVGLKLGGSFPHIFVDRSSQNLSSVPKDLPYTAEFLDLSSNHIKQLHHGDFEHTSLLKYLNMSWNSLENIDLETFLDTPHLEELDLSHNRLQNLSCQRYLLHTENLLVLNLTSNQFLTMTLGSEFSSLVHLERLALGAKNIRTNDFKSITAVKLHTLSLSLEDKLSYEAGSLRYVDAQMLQITFAGHTTIDRGLLADALSFFGELELINLSKGYDIIRSELGNRSKILTSRLHFTKISITWTEFTEAANIIFNTSISYFTFCDATMSDLPNKDTDVAKTSQMKSFTARRIEVTSFFFSQEAVYNFFVNMPVESLAITETPIIHITCPQSKSNLLHLDGSFCALSDSIFSRVEGQETIECENLEKVSELILPGNNLKSLGLISKRLRHMTSLKDLDLSLNSLLYDGLEKCVWPPNITGLNLSSNGLTDSVFKCLPTGTESLDLQNNQISVVPLSIMNLSKLLYLNLNLNRLRDLPECNGFPNLNMLLLRFNSLHAPSVNKLESCPKLRYLDVSHNPFTCTCALRSFISLGINSEQKKSHSGIELLGWPVHYLCTYPEVDRNSTLKQISFPAVSCSVSLLVATIVCPSVALIIGVMTLCHRLDVPWYIGMIWQWTRAKHRARRRQVRPEDLVGVEFHAFVSYSQHDANWVHNSLLPNLEGPAGGLRICHHEKHFVPGKAITENIITCVEKSRRSVFVLSAHFVKSEWCHYELYFASHQRLTQGLDSVVLVLLEPLPQYLIPSKYNQLKSMMGRHTYLEWPQDRAKHRLFWANLRVALQADLPDAPVRELEG
ncbi:toll-like receptor 1 [Notolabrus celidotus]|uniref:toll-like receptor 1 n=1 Tax=Notolabrus celidotus TaxID=1203425 RepID=UPI0014907284|nr:toll-like receptor 1 [Notolabrus celidotus]